MKNGTVASGPVLATILTEWFAGEETSFVNTRGREPTHCHEICIASWLRVFIKINSVALQSNGATEEQTALFHNKRYNKSYNIIIKCISE